LDAVAIDPTTGCDDRCADRRCADGRRADRRRPAVSIGMVTVATVVAVATTICVTAVIAVAPVVCITAVITAMLAVVAAIIDLVELP
jgi:hypothetical protein